MGTHLSIERIENNPKRLTLKLTGRLDGETGSLLKKEVSRAADDGYMHIAFDTADLTYLSSAGFGVFIEVMDTAEGHGGSIKFINTGHQTENIFRLLGIMIDSFEPDGNA